MTSSLVLKMSGFSAWRQCKDVGETHCQELWHARADAESNRRKLPDGAAVRPRHLAHHLWRVLNCTRHRRHMHSCHRIFYWIRHLVWLHREYHLYCHQCSEFVLYIVEEQEANAEATAVRTNLHCGRPIRVILLPVNWSLYLPSDMIDQ